ncbi:MAG: deaminase domain-containing protein [Promethearchaeota archaeon]
MLRNPSIDEEEQKFKYLSKSARQKAEVYSFNKGFYFTKFPGIEPEKFNQVIKKTVREIRKDGGRKLPDNLFRFFNAQQRRKRFNLAPGTMFKIDIYDRVSLKLIGGANATNFAKYTTKDLANYFNSYYIIHIYDPKPMPKDLVHKNGKLKDFFNIDNISITSNISRYQGYQIFNKIKNEEIKLYRGKTNKVNVLNWKQTIPQMKNKQKGIRGSGLHFALGIYKIKIGNQEEVEGYLISLNDKGPMVIFDGKIVDSSNSSFQLELGENLIETDEKGIVLEKFIKSKDEKFVPELLSIQFERDVAAFFIPGIVLHPKDEKVNNKKNNRHHGEFKILNNFVNQLGLLEHDDKTEITGEIFILSEKTPCHGCLDVLWNQFNNHFPNIKLKYNFIYGIRASEAGFQKMNLDRENSPIVVPNTQEEREVGFSMHSEFLLTDILPEDEITSYLSSFKRYKDMKNYSNFDETEMKNYSNFAETFKKFNFPYDEKSFNDVYL